MKKRLCTWILLIAMLVMLMPSTVLAATSETEKAVAQMEAWAKNDSIGYKWGGWGPEYDCGHSVITAWELAGVKVKSAGANYTGNMYNAFKKCGFSDVTAKVNLKTGAGLQRGDVLLNTKYHTAMYCGNGKLVEASWDYDGQKGDSSGKEFWIHPYYNYEYNWDYVLRYGNPSDINFTNMTAPTSLTKGGNYSLQGTITAGSNIKEVIAAIMQNGKQVKSCTIKSINSTTFKITGNSTIAKALDFSSLGVGTYSVKYAVYYNSSNSFKTWESAAFEIKSDTIVDNHDVHFDRITSYFQGQFEDVPANQWYTSSVADAFEFGLMKGDSATIFNPYGDVTIAEAVTMAARIHSIYTTGTENFVQGGKWYQVYLDYAYQNGIIGLAYYNCDVTHKATRAQFAKILANALPDVGLYAMNTVADNAIPDVKMTAAYSGAVYKLYRAGVLTGGDVNGTFSPDTYITRAETSAVVSRIAESSDRVAFTLG